jgi:hypothetical protein
LRILRIIHPKLFKYGHASPLLKSFAAYNGCIYFGGVLCKRQSIVTPSEFFCRFDPFFGFSAFYSGFIGNKRGF